jgi:peptidoglycan L-alanyl-D-glutamate endopeptidase CwlK
MSLNTVSMSRLKEVKPDLQKLVLEVAKRSSINFVITDGVRTKLRQEELFKTGKSRTMNSKHLTGDAVDVAIIVNNKAVWDKQSYTNLSVIFKEVAKELGIGIRWGGDFRNFFDGPHYELAPLPKTTKPE